MVCHGNNKDKQLFVGRKGCLTGLEAHLMTHPKECSQDLSEKLLCTSSDIKQGWKANWSNTFILEKTCYEFKCPKGKILKLSSKRVITLSE
jgi:hypothetical protein